MNMSSQYCPLQTFGFVKDILQHSPKKDSEAEGNLQLKLNLKIDTNSTKTDFLTAC